MTERRQVEYGKLYHLSLGKKIIATLRYIIAGLIAPVMIGVIMLILVMVMVLFLILSPLVMPMMAVAEIWLPPIERVENEQELVAPDAESPP